MVVFVTGGSGFVGGHVIEGLVAAGHEVRAMARSAASEAKVARYGATPVACGLDDVAAEALRGCDAVIHAAAHVADHGPREPFWAVNVEGTTRLLGAARGAGVRRFVHVGTEAILIDGSRDLVDVDETEPVPPRHRFHYAETKAEAERRVLAADAQGFTTISIRPRFVWGPRDETIYPQLARMVAAGTFAWIDGGRARTSTTHVANLVHALLLALERGRGGEAYFIADDGERTMREMLSAIALTRGLKLPSRSLPSALLRPAARALERAWTTLRRATPPPITPFAVAITSRTVTVNTDKARRELGYAPVVSVAEGLAALRAS
ncbi:MAG: NAD-dependent epimerase/dehydratase family protein [Myxococcales bacterium]|nr:NAD-dependent epimerase/dehydratase family protein [Myxococcales bacterium]